MYFDMFGPFELTRTGGSIGSRQTALWGAVRDASEMYEYERTGLERAIGCYAFGLKNGDSLKPWYVGMTIAERGFRGEVLQKHKLQHYNEAMNGRHGTPLLFLMPLLTPEGRFSSNRSSNKPLIEWVEKMLFGVALRRNPDCRNQRNTKNLRQVVVHGIFNSRPRGRKGPEVTAARAMFGEP